METIVTEETFFCLKAEKEFPIVCVLKAIEKSIIYCKCENENILFTLHQKS